MISSKSSGLKNKKEAFFQLLFLVAALFGVAAVATITIYLLVQGIPAISKIGFFKFIFGKVWHATSGQFGILSMIVNSLYVTAFALIGGGALGFFAAVFLSRFCHKKLYPALKQVVNLLAGIPSVVYGLFGSDILVSLFAKISPTGSGTGLLVSGIILSVMILPTVTSVSLNSLNSVPASYYEGALALGATKEQAVFRVVVPAAKNGIMAGMILGFGRAIGETMALTMVSGNTPQFVTGFFQSLRTMTTNIVYEMPYASGIHFDALIATGVVLFLFILLTTICFNVFLNRAKKDKKKRARVLSGTEGVTLQPFSVKRTGAKVSKGICYAAVGLTVASLLGIVLYVLIRGVPYLKMDFIFGTYSPMTPKKVTMLPAIVTTLMLIGMTLLIAVPIGVCAAIYLTEYTKKGSKLVKVIRSGVETLSGIPSIIFGMFGMIFFTKLTGGHSSIIAGCFTLVLMILPTVIRSTEEALRDVPDTFREGSLALGATKIRTIFKVVLPSAVAGIVTGVILSIGRIVGESAALIYTVGTSRMMPGGFASSGCSLAVYLYWLWGEGHYLNEAYAVAVILLLLVVILNVGSSIIENKFKKKVAQHGV